MRTAIIVILSLFSLILVGHVIWRYIKSGKMPPTEETLTFVGLFVAIIAILATMPPNGSTIAAEPTQTLPTSLPTTTPTEAAVAPTPAAEDQPTAAATAVAATQPPAPTATFEPVPAGYQALNNILDESLATFDETLETQPPAASATFWAGELFPASGNLGRTLLEPRSMDLVRQYLDGLRGLGLTGVGVQISYPLLVPDYPDSDKYLAFYQQVVQEAHQRGFKVLIETSPVFAGTQFSNVEVDYQGLTKETYFEQRKQMILTIASEIRPDYLSITHEPLTEMALTGVRMSVDDFVNFVNDTLNSLDRSSGILYGAGNGTWEDRVHIERYIQETSVDFINIHIYPVTGNEGNQLQIASELAQMSKDAGKRLVIGETWLYKATPDELARPLSDVSLGEYNMRNPYSFWQPLDIRFIQNVVGLGRAYDFDLISFFWSCYFFAYVNYNDVPRNIDSTELFRMANQAAFANLQAGKYSLTGEAYREMINQP